MSDTDSFIDEVSEEVRRDRLYATFRRYGWIAILAVLLLVAGATWNEWRKGQEREQAQNLGDAIFSALQVEERSDRVVALSEIEVSNAPAQAVLGLLAAAEESGTAPDAAAQRLLALADQSGIELVYRQVATLKAVSIPDSGLSVENRRTRLEGLALATGLTRLLAEEQLAMIEIEEGQIEASIARLQQVITDAEATAGLRRRASQVIVALGGEDITAGLGQ